MAAVGISMGGLPSPSAAWGFRTRRTGVSRPEDWGAVGDGKTDDSLAIKDAIGAADVGGTVVFTAGATYLVSGALEPLASQTLMGNGATLRRISAVSTTTTGAVTAGHFPTSIDVASVSGFRPGMQITLFKDGSTFEPANHRIIEISGNTLIVDSPFRLPWAAGTKVVTSFDVIHATVTGLQVIDLVFDDNRDGNRDLTRWEIHSAIRSSGDGVVISGCSVQNALAEGFVVGGAGTQVLKNTIRTCNGNGIHMSGTSHYVIDGNYVKDCNLAGQAPGHADGCIIFSNDTTNGTVTNNYVENGLAGFGSIDSDDNSGVAIRANTVRNCPVVVDIASLGLAEGRVTFENNKCYDSGEVRIRNLNGRLQPHAGPYDITLRGNTFENCFCTIVGARNITLSGNTWKWTASGSAKQGGGNYLVLITNSEDVQVRDTLEGAQNGLVVNGPQSARVRVGGTFVDNRYQAIQLASGVASGCVVEGVRISGRNVASTYVAVRLGNGTALRDSTIDIRRGRWAVECPPRGAVVKANQIRTTVGVPSIKMYGASRGNVATGNYLSQPIQDDGAGNTTWPNSGPGARRK